jgi:hypothetical protein
MALFLFYFREGAYEKKGGRALKALSTPEEINLEET